MDSLLNLAISAAREAGREIMALYETTDFETKADGSPVTVADSRSNEVLIERLSVTGIPILSEESTGVVLPYRDGTPSTFKKVLGLADMPNTFSPYPERMWVIDPLDSTKSFIKKSKDFAVMVGLLERGRPTLGVVYAPAHNTLYYAEKGKGAFRTTGTSTVALAVSKRSEENLRFICSTNHFSPEMNGIAEQLGATLLPRGGSGLKACLLGEDVGDFFFSRGNFGEWDICAPEIIVLEAGGRVTDCEGRLIFYGTKNHHVERGVIFSNGACHERVLAEVKATLPSEPR